MGAADDFRVLLEPGAIRAVFQPIVRLSDLGTIGYEGLARFPTPPGLVALPPDVTLAAAARAGLRDDIEVACWRAIAAAGVPPHGRLLWVNLSPEALGHPGLLELAGKLPSRLVIELTEQDTVLNHALLRERLRPWIARGALVAVDDAGAGFTSLEYVADIRPDFLKLSRGMVAGVDLDSTREAVLRATAAFAREVGARVVAEGVERVEELEALRAMEIDYGQGWLFGRPGEAWPREASACESEPARRVAVSGRLERDLDKACTARDASEAIVDHLARRGLLPAVYLAQEGRLRCRAVRGYWQVFDGLAPSTGIVGRVFRTGHAAIVHDVGDAPDYLPAVPGVRAEVCFPLVVAGQVIGVLNAESVTAIDATAVAEIEHCASLLSARLEEVGAVGASSPRNGWRGPRCGWRRRRTPRASCARRCPPRWSFRASSRAWSPSLTATARSTRTSPKARSAWPSANSRPRSSRRSRRGWTRGRRPTPSVTPPAAASSATRCCAARASGR